MTTNSAQSVNKTLPAPKVPMYAMNPAGFPTNSAHEILSYPEKFLPLLARRIPEDVVFFSKEINGKFVFVSGSCEAVLTYSRSDLVNHALCEFLTDNSINADYLAGCWIGTDKHEPSQRRCEIVGRNGDRIQVAQWDIPVFHEGIFVGLTGVLWNPSRPPEEVQGVPQQDRALLEMVSKLTPVEREVVELVVDGYMNKKIAAQLGVALRTIESRRARAMNKLNVVSLSQLVQCWMNVRRLEGR